MAKSKKKAAKDNIAEVAVVQSSGDGNYPIVSSNPAIQKRYIELRGDGVSHNFAEMFALQKSPRVRDTYSPMHPRRGRGQGGR